MTNVIELAKQARLIGDPKDLVPLDIQQITDFAKLVRNAAVQDERTALAELCDAMGSPNIAEYLREQAAAIESLKEPTP